MTESEVQAILVALSEPNRVEILRQLAKKDCEVSCVTILQGMPVAQSTLSHHIKELVGVGLLTHRPEGRTAKLSFNRERFEEFVDALQKIF